MALSQGRCLAEALVLHPQESAAALICVRTDWADPAALNGGSDVSRPAARKHIDRLDADFKTLVTALLGQQRVFDLGDEIILHDDGSIVTTPDGCPVLRVGAMNYPAVILPSMVSLAASTFRLLQEFQNLGGPIFLAGEAPTLVEGLPSAELALVIEVPPGTVIAQGELLDPAPDIGDRLAYRLPAGTPATFSQPISH